jgi:hypothetical protein
MPPHIKNTRKKLERQRALALEVFKKEAEAAYESFIAAEAGLKYLGVPENLRYAQALGDLEAVNACLEYEGEWLPIQKIADLVHRGGYPMDPIRGSGLLIQNIRKHVQRGNLQQVDGLVGRIDWKSDET